MQKRLAQIFGTLALGIGVLGLVSSDDRLFGLVNASIAMDATHIVLGVALLYVGFSRINATNVHNVLAATGVIYVLIAALGTIEPKLWGFAPGGLTGFDMIIHVTGGLVAIVAAFAPHAHNSSAHA